MIAPKYPPNPGQIKFPTISPNAAPIDPPTRFAVLLQRLDKTLL